MQADIHECVACGQEFDLSKGGIVYKGREGLVHMCEEHVPDKFNDEALAEDMGVTLRDDDGIYDEFEPTGWHDDPQWDD